MSNKRFLQNEDEKTTDVEEMKGRKAKREKPKGRDDAERQNQKANFDHGWNQLQGNKVKKAK